MQNHAQLISVNHTLRFATEKSSLLSASYETRQIRLLWSHSRFLLVNRNYRQKSELFMAASERRVQSREKVNTAALAPTLQHLHPHQGIIRRHLMLLCRSFGWWKHLQLSKSPCESTEYECEVCSCSI